jgi:hypothetical protein
VHDPGAQRVLGELLGVGVDRQDDVVPWLGLELADLAEVLTERVHPVLHQAGRAGKVVLVHALDPRDPDQVAGL